MDTSTDKALVPVRQEDVEFYGDALTGVFASDQNIYVPLKEMCEALGLNTNGQAQRIRRNEVLAESLTTLSLQTPAGMRPSLCLRVDLVPGWLAGVSTEKIENEAIRKKLIAYQRDLFGVLWRIFGPEHAAVMPATRVEALAREMAAIMNRMEAIDEAVSALYDMLGEQSNATKAISVLVEGLKTELSALRSDVGNLETRPAGAFKIASDKLKRLEVKLNPGERITDEQAARIKEGVNHIASEMRKRGKERAYGEIWGAFDHYFNVPEYRQLPQGKFAEALDWLTRWETDLLEGKPPETK